MTTIYALLAAIADYPQNGVSSLSGTLNDLEALDGFLSSYKEVNGVNYKPHTLTDAECTRNKLIKAFSHFEDASEGDICIFFFSGHGAWVNSPKEFWNRELDRKCETIVCYDSRDPGGYDLVDKEIAYLLHKCVPEGAHCLALFDSCHSGTMTKDISLNITPKNLGGNPSLMPFEAFEGYEEYLPIIGTDYCFPPQRDHVTLSACLDREVAIEMDIDGNRRGLFSYSLLKTLAKVDLSRLSYQELLERVQTEVANRHPQQTVYGEAAGTAEMRSLFLNGTLTNPTLFLSYDRQANSWFFRQGAAHGILLKSKVVVALDDEWKELSIQSVEPGKTFVGTPSWLDREVGAYTVDVSERSTNAMAVVIDEQIDKATKEVVKSAAKNYQEYFDLGENAGARYRIKAYGDNRLALVEGHEPRPVFEAMPFEQLGDLELFLERVGKVGRYWGIQRLKSELNQLPLEDVIDIKFEKVYIYNETEDLPAALVEDLSEPIILPYRRNEANTKTVSPRYRVSVRVKPGFQANGRKLFVGMLYFDEAFKVSGKQLPMKELAAGGEWYVTSPEKYPERNYISVSIPKRLRDGWEVREIENYLKIIVSEQEINFAEFEQRGLPQEIFPTDQNFKGAVPRGEGEDDEEDVGAVTGKRWGVKDITLRIVKPEILDRIKSHSHPKLLNVKGPEGFDLGPVVFTSSRSVTRAIATQVKPPDFSLLGLVPADLNRSDSTKGETHLTRGDAPVDDMMVIYGGNEHQNKEYKLVDPDSPLRFQLDRRAESMMVLGYDEETQRYYPVGGSGEDGIVQLNQLPNPTPDPHTKGVGDSIKLYFQRIETQKKGFLGADLLQQVTVGEDCQVKVVEETPAASLESVVAGAKRIAIFLHGIIGDNLISPGVLQQASYQEKPLQEQYDLILTFDYENLGTRIGDIADNFRICLTNIGLVPGHDKMLHIYAHSMGGLVSRHYIEMLDGDQVVSHLIQFGTPNNGSPLPGAYGYMVAGLTYALNNVIKVFPWGAPLTTAAGWFTKGTQKSLTDMKDGSEYLLRLNQPRPRTTPYSMVNGNTRLIIPKDKQEEEAAFLARILRRVDVNKTVDKLFFRAPNDIAVSIESQQTIPGTILQQAEVACDHMHYFNSPAGVAGLETLLEGILGKESAP